MMDLNIRELSKTFSELLPQDKEKYTLNDIETSGIPFLVRKRIFQIAHHRFIESVQSPESDWADSQSSKAQFLWNKYLQEMKGLLEIPVNQASDVIHQATDFTLKLAVQPRKTTEKVLYKENDTITKDELSGRLNEFVSNRHLAYALIRYMEKKQRNSIGVDEARQIITKVDEKLIDSYNSLDWMEAVKPIFNVAGPVVESDLIRVFFEEKGLHRVARKFDMMDSGLHETDFIEVMSSADLLDTSGFEEEQPALFTDDNIVSHGTDPVESVETDDPPIDDESTKNTLSDLFVSDEEDVEKSADIEEIDDLADGEEQNEPYLLQLFKEDNENDSNKEAAESNQAEEAEDYTEEEISEEFETADKTESEKLESDLSDEFEDGCKSEKEIEISDQLTADEPEVDESEEEEVVSRDEDNKDMEKAVLPLEKELFADEEKLAKKEDEEIEEEALLDQFVPGEDQQEFDELNEEDRKEENVEPTSIYDELNLSAAEEDDEPEKETNFEKGKELESKDETHDFELEDEIPFEPNDRIGEEFDEDDDSDDFETYTSAAAESGDDFDVASPEDENEDEEEDATGVPMWKSFLERDNPDDEPSFYFDEGSDESTGGLNDFNGDEDEINETPVISISGEASKIDDEIEHLSKWLAADYDRFLHEIFNDSKLAWEQALIDLTVFDDWKSASRYLQNEIFNKNQIDIYSEIAVDFTDYLHSYFMEYKS